MATRFYLIAKGERFTFPLDPSYAVCIKTGPNTYRVESARDPASVGLVCSVQVGAHVDRIISSRDLTKPETVV